MPESKTARTAFLNNFSKTSAASIFSGAVSKLAITALFSSEKLPPAISFVAISGMISSNFLPTIFFTVSSIPLLYLCSTTICFVFPTASANSLKNLINACASFCANSIPPSMVSSLTSFAPASIITTDVFVDETTRSSSDSFNSEAFGLRIYFLSLNPTFTVATGPSQGIVEE